MDFFFIPVVLSVSALLNRYLREKVRSRHNDFAVFADSRASWFCKDIAWDRLLPILPLADNWYLSSRLSKSEFSRLYGLLCCIFDAPRKPDPTEFLVSVISSFIIMMKFLTGCGGVGERLSLFCQGKGDMEKN